MPQMYTPTPTNAATGPRTLPQNMRTQDTSTNVELGLRV